MISCTNKADQAIITSYYSAKELPGDWDDLLPAGHFLKRSSVAVSEEAQLPDISYIYTLISKNGKPCAAAYFQLLSIKEKHLDVTSLVPWQRIGWKLFASIAHPKLLVAGHLFRHDIASFYAVESLSAFDTYQLYKAAIDKTLKDSCAQAVLVKDMPAGLDTYFQHYAPGYIMLRNDISMQLAIPETWDSISDYEKALKHKYAQRYRKIRQAFNGVVVRELSQQQIDADKEKLYALYLKVCNRQQARIGYLSVDYLPLLKKQYPDVLKIWGIYENDVMIGFFSAWVRPDVFDMFYIGFDYDRNADLQLYFNILYFSIEQAIHFRKSKLVLGRTALDAKARLGCKPHYLCTFVHINNRYVRTAVQQIQNKAATQDGEWEQRHPFKTQ